MKILLPTDFSKNSLDAIFYSMELFGAGHNWTLLNCFHTPHAGARVMVKIDDILAESSVRDLDVIEKKIRQKFNENDYPIQVISEHGEVVRCIDIMVDQHKYDLITLGTKGASGLKEVFMGSFASKVVEHADLPVLAIPELAVYKGLNRLAVADDEETVKNNDCAKLVNELIDMHQPKIMMVNVSTKEGDVYEPSGIGIDGLLAKHERSHHNVKHNDIAKGLRQFNADNQIDLLVMLHRKESAFMEWLTTSTSEDMAMHARVPILALKA